MTRALMFNQNLDYPIVTITWLLSVLSVSSGNLLQVTDTTLNPGSTALRIFWIFTVAVQAIFLTEYYTKASKQLQEHFFLNSVLTFAWYWLQHKGATALAFVAGLFIFLNAACAYVRDKSYEISSLKNWLGVHIPVVAIPFVTGIYLTLNYGLHALHVHKKFFGAHTDVLALFLFLIIPGVVLIRFADWGVGLLAAYIVISMCVHSGKHRIQNYAGLVGAILFLASVFLAYRRPRSLQLSNDQAPLLG